VKIAASGIVVQVMNSSSDEITRGLNQAIIFDPVAYSYDLDSLYSIKSLMFKFYCYIMDDGITTSTPFVGLNQKIDLLSAALKQNYTSCFNSVNAYSFDSSGNKLMIASGGLSYVSNRKYRFSIETAYLGNVYSKTITVSLNGYSKAPVISIKYKIEFFSYSV
jgi:hypothetical protein